MGEAPVEGLKEFHGVVPLALVVPLGRSAFRIAVRGPDQVVHPLKAIPGLLELRGSKEDQIEGLNHRGGEGQVLLPHQQGADSDEDLGRPKQGAQPSDDEATPLPPRSLLHTIRKNA